MRITLSLATTMAIVLATNTTAQTYYTVDWQNDELYQINPANGAATLIGPLGSDLGAVCLAWHQDALYAKTFDTVNGSRVYQIVTTGVFAGQAIAGGVLGGGGYQGAEIGGLASDGTFLHLAYSNELPGGFISNQLGQVDVLTGAMTLVDTIPFPMDADNMAFRFGQFWGMDVISPAGGCRLYRGATAPDTLVGVMSYDSTLATNPSGIEQFSPSEFVAISQNGRNLVRVNRFTGARGTVTAITGIPANAVLSGIARSPDPCLVQIRGLTAP